MSKYPTASTPDFCPFSVEIEPSSSNSFEHLRFSTVSKSWSLAMRTTNSNLVDEGDSDKDEADADDELSLNEMDADIERALSNEKAPVGLVPISSDSESSSQNESIDIYSDEEEGTSIPFPTPGAGSSHPHGRKPECSLSPRPSKTPKRGELQRNPQQQGTQKAAPLPNPLSPLKVLNPGVPQGHANHRHHKRHNSLSRVTATPQRGDNTLVTANSNVATTLAADCMCFAIEDVTQFFCPATPKSTTIDNTTQCPPGIGCFPAYDYGATSSPKTLGGSFPSIGFWAGPKLSPRPWSREEQREALFLLNANLPRNRSHGQKRKHVRKLLTVWHGEEGLDSDRFGPRDDFHVVDKRQRRRQRKSVTQPKCCYDSDPEHEVRGKWQRRISLIAGDRVVRSNKPTADEPEPQLLEESDGKQQHPRYQKFRPEPFTHLDTDEESSSDADESSYETAKLIPEPSEPGAPRSSDPGMSFDFGKTLTSVSADGTSETSEEPKTEEQAAFEFGKVDCSRSTGKGHRRVTSMTSLSTTGHSRFHTIRISPEQVQEGSDSSEASSDGFSSISGSTALNPTQKSRRQKRQHEHHPLPSYFKSFPTHWTEFQLLFSRNVDEDSVKSHVHELSNVRFPLVWHPSALSSTKASESKKGKCNGKTSAATAGASDIHCPTSVKIASLSSNANEKQSSETKPGSAKSTQFPINVQGAFEVGAHLDHMVVQPKFTWTPAAQPHRISEDPDANHRELFLSGSAPPQVELLSIIRVNKATGKQLDRNLYPYARRDRTCIVTTNDANHPTIVLEARSTQERDWLVFSLKLIVARLASIIITRDEDMLHEFFSPYSALMQLEEEDRSALRRESNSQPPSQHRKKEDFPTVECAATPTRSCGKAVMVIDGEGTNDSEFPKDTQEVDAMVDDDPSTDTALLVDEVVDSNEEDMVDEQDRDDREIEDAIRARNSGAYAILKRSLSATGPLMDYEEPYHHEALMPRCFSY